MRSITTIDQRGLQGQKGTPKVSSASKHLLRRYFDLFLGGLSPCIKFLQDWCLEATPKEKTFALKRSSRDVCLVRKKSHFKKR